MALDLTALTNPYGQELAGIERNRALATALMQGGQQQPQGQMISGRYIAPSLAQNLNPLLQTAVGLYGQKKADTAETQLANTIQSKQADLLRQYGEATTPQEKFAIGTNLYAPAALQAATWERLKPQKLGEGETINEYDFAKGGYNPIAQGGEKKTEAIRGYEMAKSQGFPGSFFDYEQQLKRAGASNVSVSMDKGIAAQIGPIMKEGQLQATSAVKGIDAANQVINALDTNKLFTGPLANQRLTLAQLGTTFGGASGDLTQKINNTRAAIQGLAEITLQGRQEMHGQGAITESEGKLAERAKSGDVSLTPGELKQLANAAKRAGEFTYNNYQTKLQVMSKDPATAQMAPYFAVNQMPPRQAPQQVQQQNVQPNANQQLNIPSTNGWSVIGVK
jgi:hypothetical protein